MSFLFGNRSNKTFKPKKNIPEGTHQYDLMKHAAATLGSGDLRLAVMLPEGEDLNEWVAVNIVDFFNQINMLYGTITEFCTEETCPLMSAGPKYEYHWADGTTVKKPIKCSAPKYIDYLMTWVQDQLDDENIFPSKIGVPFPKNFISIAKTILKRLFRVYAHIYHQHFQQIVRLDEEAHLNTSFKHFIFFVQEFNLIDKRELAPLSELIEKLVEKRNPTATSTTTAASATLDNSNTNQSGIVADINVQSMLNHHHQQQQQQQLPHHHLPHPLPHGHPHHHIGNHHYNSTGMNNNNDNNNIQPPYTPPRISGSSSYPAAPPPPPPPHYPIKQSLPPPLPLPKPIQAQQQQQYYNIKQQQTPPPPPPAYHQHLQQQRNSGNIGGGGIIR
uniref:MOB kinase activator 1B n=1 Tax=Dermatophagoides pteronyssinus TaxID=6956 RepID=A0A6P6XMD4_DERPT|nr:MOB kinase activator 1B [Dermatophagoides pteronyssinus]